MAAVLCDGELESVRERYLGLLRRCGLFVGVALSLGVDALSFRHVDELRRCRMGLDAGRKLVWR